MVTSRTIGYQEKNVKQSTAPIRKPCADRLRRTFGPSRPAVPARAARGSALGSRSVATPAIRALPSLGTAARGPAPDHDRPHATGVAGYPPLLARIVLTLAAAVFSRSLMLAFGSVSTASMTGSSVL